MTLMHFFNAAPVVTGEQAGVTTLYPPSISSGATLHTPTVTSIDPVVALRAQAGTAGTPAQTLSTSSFTPRADSALYAWAVAREHGTGGTPTVTVNTSGGNGTVSSQTVTSASFTPTANSTLYVWVISEEDGGGGDPNWTTSSISGGGLSWSLVTTTSGVPWNSDNNFTTQAALFKADVGGSPSSMTVTLDANTGSSTPFFYDFTIFSVTGTSGQVQVAANSATKAAGDSETLTVTLGSAATSGNLVLALFAASNDGTGAFASISGWTEHVNRTAPYNHVGLWSRIDFSGSSVTQSDLGQAIGAGHGVVLELSAAGSGADPDWSASSITGGGLSWEMVAETSTVDHNGDNAKTVKAALFKAAVGSSPSSMTVTVDPDTAGSGEFEIDLDVFDVDGFAYVAQSSHAVAQHDLGDAESLTLTLGAAATSGRPVIACFAGSQQSTGSFASISGWTETLNRTTSPLHTGVWWRDDFTGTTVTQTDLGQAVGAGLGVVIETTATEGPPTLVVPSISSGATLHAPRVGIISGLWPTSVHSSGRYLLDQNDDPWFGLGDTAWSMMVQLSPSQITTYLEDRATRGVNLVLVNAIEHQFGTNAPNNYDNEPPFTGTAFQSSLNEAYWQVVDHAVAEAARLGITLLICPAYLGFPGSEEGWNDEVVAASNAQMTAYGQALAARYSSYPNIMWIIGHDRVPNATEKEREKYLADAIQAGTSHLLTVGGLEANLGGTGSGRQDWAGSGIAWDFDTVYSYEFDASELAESYALTPTIPTGFFEGRYENEAAVTRQQLRAQTWENFCAGGCYTLFGNSPIWKFDTGWSTALGSNGSVDNLNRLYTFMTDVGVAWASTAPDTTGTFLTSGQGEARFNTTLGIIYADAAASIVVDTTEMAGSGDVKIRRFDPTTGSFSTVTAGEPQSAARTITYPGTNSAGGTDWIYVIELAGSQTVEPPAISSTATLYSPSISLSGSPTAESAAATATSNDPTETVAGVSDTASVSTTSNQPSQTVSVTAQSPVPTAAANDAAQTTSSTAQAPAAAGAAQDSTQTVSVTAESAVVVAASYETTSVAEASAGTSSATATAPDAGATESPIAESASASATAITASASSVSASEAAMVDGAAIDGNSSIAASSDNGVAQSIAYDGAQSTSPVAGSTTVTGTAFDPSSSSSVSAVAQSATVTGTAFDIIATAASTPQVAAAPGTALAPSGGVSVDTGVSVVASTSNEALQAIDVTSEQPTAEATAFNPSSTTEVLSYAYAEVAVVAATATNAGGSNAVTAQQAVCAGSTSNQMPATAPASATPEASGAALSSNTSIATLAESAQAPASYGSLSTSASTTASSSVVTSTANDDAVSIAPEADLGIVDSELFGPSAPISPTAWTPEVAAGSPATSTSIETVTEELQVIVTVFNAMTGELRFAYAWTADVQATASNPIYAGRLNRTKVFVDGVWVPVIARSTSALPYAPNAVKIFNEVTSRWEPVNS